MNKILSSAYKQISLLILSSKSAGIFCLLGFKGHKRAVSDLIHQHQSDLKFCVIAMLSRDDADKIAKAIRRNRGIRQSKIPANRKFPLWPTGAGKLSTFKTLLLSELLCFLQLTAWFVWIWVIEYMENIALPNQGAPPGYVWSGEEAGWLNVFVVIHTTHLFDEVVKSLFGF